MANTAYNRVIHQLLLLVGVSIAGPLLAQDVTRLYSTDDLTRAGKVYARNIQAMWEQDFIAKLDPEERRRASGITLLLPLVGANRNPLDYYAEPGTRRVYLPIASVKFLDDMSIAAAWYERQGCDLSTVSDYVALLRMHPQDFNVPPLEALGVPDNALDDIYVDDVSQKLLKSILFFLASHEYAHVMYGHQSYADIPAEQAQAQEVEADTFALDVMRRVAVAPTAMSYLFMLSTRLEATPGDFGTEAEYRQRLSQGTHPIGARRIEAVADNIETNLSTYADAQDNPVAYRASLNKVAGDLHQMASDLADGTLRDYLASSARDIDPAQLATKCTRP